MPAVFGVNIKEKAYYVKWISSVFDLISILHILVKVFTNIKILSIFSARVGEISAPVWAKQNTWKAFKHVLLLLEQRGSLFHPTRTKKLLSMFRLTAHKSLLFYQQLPLILSLHKEFSPI